MRPAPERKRVPTWPERLAALIEERRHTPFVWGTHDCCLFAADAVLATTGADPAAEWRGRYDSEAEALELLGARGLEGTVADAMAAFGAPECPVLAAQRGDVVLATSGNEPLVGVAFGSRIVVPGPERLVFLPLSAGSRAWAV
ncbi:MAG TPA: hypothetical protein VL154_16205 [Acetobacteraceae bacterium]|nr:hypothetical protein [Acetobacteraceae bacterium]